MEIANVIKESPEWVALIVALGGLAFQQRQIYRMSNRIEHQSDSEVNFLRSEVARLRSGLDDVRLALMRKTDLNGESKSGS